MKIKLLSAFILGIVLFESCVDLNNNEEIRWPGDVKVQIALERIVNEDDSINSSCTVLFVDKYNYVTSPDNDLQKINGRTINKINIPGSTSNYFQLSSPDLIMPDSAYTVQITMDDGNVFYARVRSPLTDFDSLIAPSSQNPSESMNLRWYPTDSTENVELVIQYFIDNNQSSKLFEVTKAEKIAGQKTISANHFTGGYSKMELYLRKYTDGVVDSVFYNNSFIRAYNIRKKTVVFN